MGRGSFHRSLELGRSGGFPNGEEKIGTSLMVITFTTVGIPGMFAFKGTKIERIDAVFLQFLISK